jgi:Leucine-rich repeat (LRR) protein
VDLELFSAKEQLGDNDLPTLSSNIPSFHNSPHLNEIYLQGNALNGNIPDNFLESSEARNSDSYVVYIGLDDNRLEGTIPESLGGIKNLIIDINDNFIEKIPDSLCKITAWQNGGVGDYGCDAILCPKGKYVAPTGRQVKDSAPCQKCNVEGGAQFMGSTRCISLAEMETRPVLIDMYNQLGGNEWWSNENWLSEEADVCSWYGVNCTEDKSVTGIFLGSNNLKGTLSPDFWTIPGLATVWLYSNPELVITFDGIEKATSLKTLLIDATGLTSLEGLENAKSLEELDLRFNNLKGPFPYRQISELKSLTTLSLANSGLTGTLNSYGMGEKSNLKKLRLGGNELDGPLPDFSDFPKLESLDLSDNFFTGRIPDDFLKDIADPSKPITVDLAMNKLAGTIPSGPFMKFKDLTLYLRENEFIELATDLCTKDKWNGGDVGKYGCDGLLCPRGTFSESGRQKSDDTPCEKCDLPTSFFMGAVECALQATTLRVESAATGYSLVWTVAISLFGLMGSLSFLGEI